MQEGPMHNDTQNSVFEELPLEEMSIADLGIEELESRVQLSGTSISPDEWSVEVMVGVSW
jgi:hypothetical protein